MIRSLEVVGMAMAAGLVMAVVVFVLRRRALRRGGGSFDCSVRRGRIIAGRGWMLGIARYTGDSLVWYRVFSLAARPKVRLARAELAVVSRRPPDHREAFALVPGAVVLTCVSQGRTVELGLSEEALTGFLSWLEAAPPGQHVTVA